MLSGRLLFYLKKKEKLAEMHHMLPLFVIRCTTRSHSLSLICHSLSLDVTRSHSLSLVVPLVGTRCHSMYNSSVFL